MSSNNALTGKDAVQKKEIPMDKIISRAAWLLAEGRVVRISPYLYYVMGKVGKHLVRVEGGKLVCTCKGFQEKGICSHVVAVSTLLELKDVDLFLDERIRERVRKELREIFNSRNR
ncbi:MAG: SWIM zinc finger family protein [Infirmifilum sp.]